MTDVEMSVQADDIIPSFTNPDFTPSDFGCGALTGVEWIRRFPMSEGFLIKIIDAPENS